MKNISKQNRSLFTFFLAVIFALCFLTKIPEVHAFGECDQYGFMATYDILTDSCKCMHGYSFDRGLFGDLTCVSNDSICKKQFGIMSYNDYLTDKCKCSYGYIFQDNYSGTSCVNGNTACHDKYGFYSSFNASDNTCECDSGYIFEDSYTGRSCVDGDIVCHKRHGLYSSFEDSSRSCVCDDEYTFDDYNQCVEKQHNVYFLLKELSTDNRQAIIKSEYDYKNYLITYGIGCYTSSFRRYINNDIVVNLGTDYEIDRWDSIVLQDDDEVCDIINLERVDNDFSFPEDEQDNNYLPLLLETINNNNSSSTADNPINVSQCNDGYIYNDGRCQSIFDVDANQSQFSNSILDLKNKGIISGYTDGTFKPFNPINRAEFIKTVIGAKFKNDSILDRCTDSGFTDIPEGSWYANYVCAAKGFGIIGGYADGTFKPDQQVNAAEALKIMLKTFGVEVREPDKNEAWYKPFTEYAKNNNYYLNTFDSENKLLTREDMAELIHRVMSSK
ncbi:MAG: S-layer homology domain-containing protein [Patescibacteria group bacterium]